MEVKGNIRVYCRIWPLIEKERETDSAIGEEMKVIDIENVSVKDKNFKFDRILGPQTTQAQLYIDIQ